MSPSLLDIALILICTYRHFCSSIEDGTPNLLAARSLASQSMAEIMDAEDYSFRRHFRLSRDLFEWVVFKLAPHLEHSHGRASSLRARDSLALLIWLLGTGVMLLVLRCAAALAM